MAITIKSNNKTRDLSVLQLFEILQEEYIVCELRAIIYPLQKHKDYWKETMEKKKEKIVDISRRNSLPCIFDDKRIKEDYQRKVIPEVGYPKFLYRDSNQQLIQEKWDLHNYYSQGTEVKVFNDGGIEEKGIIVSVNFNRREASIKIIDTITIFGFDVITRILII